MTARLRTAGIVALLCVLVGTVVAGAVVADLNGEGWVAFVGGQVPALAFGVVGGMVVAFRPGQLVGRLFIGISMLWVFGTFGEHWARHSLTRPEGPLPGTTLAAWLGEWYWLVFGYCILVFVPLLFPTGRLLSPRWRPVLWAAIAFAGSFTLLASFDPFLDVPVIEVAVRNPLGIDFLSEPEEGASGVALFLGSIALSVASVTSLLMRFKRARGEERQQLKWFSFSGALFLAGFILAGAVDALVGQRPPFVDLILLALVPVSAAVSILRYRLYDIDILINRTLVYALLSGILAASYLGFVLFFRNVLAFGSGSEVAVAASTLAVAALFGPIRRRVQGFIDRRFYRAKYDAERTLQEFAARLRDQVDLPTLTEELVEVVDEAIRPTSVSLWLRSPTEGEPA